ncbi:auxin-responsive protein SAUR71-like [Diospyros lotus]|uniref:auxin-responsive protein SAUR71-like n=1 Tax=Diospyros lotus TaxID=55363 RepID=UPI00225ACBD7|nr:auxin-responsive protein SAUR71-like [Diospyros lotus]XP_052208409.1 auxin-responsive protein SAUR71-like [Diospyros lotus]
MKNLFRRLSRIEDFSHYFLFRSESPPPPPPESSSDNVANAKSSSSSNIIGNLFGSKNRAKVAPVGHLVVYVGEEMERFVLKAELLNHPIFVKLLNASAQEYGYEQRGALRIPCDVFVFERVLEAFRVGDEKSRQDLLESLCDDGSHNILFEQFD